jgi:Skp family chaperone for outer membrane proteins
MLPRVRRASVLVPALILALALALSACNGQEAKPAVAVVDLAAVQNSSTVVADVAAHLDSLRGKLMAEALEAEKAFQAEETDETRQAYMTAVDNFEKAVGAEEQRIFTTLSGHIDRILAEIREKRGLQAILLKDTVLSVDPAQDITTEVTTELDKVQLDLTMPETGAAAPTGNETAAPEEPEAAQSAPAEQ